MIETNIITPKRDTGKDADIILDLEIMAKSIQKELNKKENSEEGKGLSTNDFTNELKDKLEKLNTQDDKVVKGHYDEENKQIILELQSGNKIAIPVNDLLDDFYVKQTIDELLKEKQDQINYLDKTLTRAEASGENINIKNSAEYPISNISIDTNIKQDSREGYNLLNENAILKNTMIDSGNGEAKTNSYYISTDFISIIPLQKYTLSWKSEKEYAGLRIAFYNSNKEFISGSIIESGYYFKYTFESIANAEFVRISILSKVNEVEAERKKIQLIEGTTEKPYEQYGSMPSIEFPSEIKTPVGKQSFYAGNKNWFDSSFRKSDGTILGVMGKATEENGVYSFVPTATTGYIWEVLGADKSYIENNGQLFKIPEDKKVSISSSNPVFSKIYITYFDENLISLGFVLFSLDKFSLSNIPENAKYFTLRIGLNSSLGIVVGNTYTTTIQVEYEDTPTEIVEHQSQVQDIDVGELLGQIVDKEDGSYFENRYLRARLTSNTSWAKSSSGNWYYTTIWNLSMEHKSYILSTHFKKSAWNLTPNDSEICLGNNVSPVIGISATTFESIDTLKTFLDENEVYIIGELATPTYTKLTDEQQEQWNKIKKMHTYEGVTNIYTINENGISPVINMKYVKSPKVVEENLQAQIDKLKNSIISMGGNV